VLDRRVEQLCGHYRCAGQSGNRPPDRLGPEYREHDQDDANRAQMKSKAVLGPDRMSDSRPRESQPPYE
jgi:hypothetical protein